MPPLRLRLDASLAELIRSLHPNLKRKVKAALQAILQQPHCGKSLKDELSGLRSFRVGNFRIVYKQSASSIDLVAIGPRKTIYEETYKLIRKSQGL